MTADAEVMLRSVYEQIDYRCYGLRLAIEDCIIQGLIDLATNLQREYNVLVCLRQWLAIEENRFHWEGPEAKLRLFIDEKTLAISFGE